ncbi:serum amyloid P-component-like [Erythrolamprus reginae]|uniref:serum amyloid P-component-like n=1 Tax=Erythrolamprus reginae TaxID=121349 RepID=UPI00396C9923
MALLPSLLLIACLPGSFGQTDLQKKVFVFPAAANKAMVQVNVSLQQPWTNLTVCLRYSPVQIRPYTLFSYSTKPKRKDLQIIRPNPSQFNLQIGGMTQIIPLWKTSPSGWQHVCVAWNSTTGLVHFWHDGELYPRFVMKKGYEMQPTGSIILGQDDDSWGRREGFVGEMADVNVWPRVLKPDEIQKVKKNDEVANSVVNWGALNYQLHDDISVEQALHQVS